MFITSSLRSFKDADSVIPTSIACFLILLSHLPAGVPRTVLTRIHSREKVMETVPAISSPGTLDAPGGGG